MAGAVIPAIVSGGTSALKYLPKVVDQVKKQLPTVYAKVAEYTGKSGQTPGALAVKAAAGDKFLGQAVLETLMKNGVSPEFISKAAPVFPVEQLRSLVIDMQNIDVIERKVADSKSVDIQGDSDTVLIHDNVHITRLCKSIGIRSEALLDLVQFIQTRGPAQIVRYQKFERGHGRIPL